MRPSLAQLLICVLIIVLLFGAGKIPQIARSLGKAKGEFKKGLAEGERDDEPTTGGDAAKLAEKKD